MNTWWDTWASWVTFWRPSAPPHGDIKSQDDKIPQERQTLRASAVIDDEANSLSRQPYVFVNKPVEPCELADNRQEPTSGKDHGSRIADDTLMSQGLDPRLQKVPTQKFRDLTRKIISITQFPVYEATHSNVHKAELDGEPVAVKVFRGAGVTPATRDILDEKLQVWGKFNHENILPLYGYCNDFGKQGALVSPWYENGNIGSYIRQTKPNLTLSERFQLWFGVLEGLVYLHVREVVHGDLKPTNVLVDNEGKARICDFGLATIFSEGMVGATPTPVHTSTMRYLPYELIVAEDTVTPTKASDIYALGCLALEIIFLTSPFANRRNPAQIFRDVARRDPPAQSMPIKGEPPQILRQFWEILETCWDSAAEKRPEVHHLKDFVDGCRKELTEIVEKDFFVVTG